MICLKIRIKELPDVGVQIEMTTTNKSPTQNEMGVAHVLNNVVRRAAKLEEKANANDVPRAETTDQEGSAQPA